MIIGTAIYSAYFYQPKEYAEYESEYLKQTATQYIKLENYTAHFLREGAGETVILVHGGGSWLYSFQNNIGPLSEHFEVYALDMPGHGYTTALDEPVYDLDTYADFIYEFMEAQQIEKASFVGNSWGGGWAMHFAAKYPDKTGRLILIDSSGLDMPDKSEWKYMDYPVLGEIIANFITLNATKNSLENMVYDSSLITGTYAKEIFTPLSGIYNRRAQYLSQRNLDWKITDNQIERLNQQVLLIFGDNDPYFDAGYANQMDKRLKNSRLVLLEKAGHLPHEENPDEVNKAIYEFLLG